MLRSEGVIQPGKNRVIVAKQDATGRWRIYESTDHGCLLASGHEDKSFSTYSRAIKYIEENF